MQIVIGKSEGRNIFLDVDVFLRTRMLVQAASGQGKSHWLRRLCEQLFGKAQIFIIDHEGEFSTLRPSFDFLVIGEGGDAPADVRSAALLAQKLLEVRASAVFDLSEAFRKHPRDRHTWVKNFIFSMMEAPKRLWHPVVVIVDEAHKFAPEKDESEALEAMISLSTDGRKRQFCAVYATQRLGKLAKDAASELLNVMIGGTVLDIDRKRAADALGVYGNELRPFNDQIKTIERGNFWCLGPAISQERVLVRVGETESRPPRFGSGATLEAPPPTEKIKALLPQLADLPKIADTKAKTEAELRTEIASLKRQVSARQSQVQDPKIQEKLNTAVAEARTARQAMSVVHADFKALASKGARLARDLTALAKSAGAMFDVKLPELPAHKIENLKVPGPPVTVRITDPLWNKRPVQHELLDEGSFKVYGTPKKMLQAIAEFEAIGVSEPTRGMVASWCGIKSNTGTFKTYVSTLAAPGLVSLHDDRMALTDKGRDCVAPVTGVATTEELLGRASGLFGKTPANILKILHDAYPKEVSREEIGERLEVSHESGTFKTYISELRSAGMIEDGQGRTLKCSEWLFIS